MSSLFDDEDDDRRGRSSDPPSTAAGTPLAERMRPRTLDEIVGQDDILAPGKPLREAIERDLLQSIILWGPPGTGKTTLARVIAEVTHAHFVPFSAVLAGIKEIKEVMAAAQDRRRRIGRRTIVFVDEIHRFNKAQQDAFLPRVEAGDIVLIGATTENPSFEVNAALLSRSKVFVLKALPAEAVETHPAARADGQGTRTRDAGHQRHRRGGHGHRPLRQRRRAFGAQPARVRGRLSADRSRDHAFVNSDSHSSSNRFSDAPCSTTRAARSTTTSSPRCTSRCGTATLTRRSTGWRACSRPARIRCTSRDAWSASPPRTSATPIRRRWPSPSLPRTPPISSACPKGNTALAQAAIYLATAPKSNAVYTAYNAAAADAHTQAAEPVPLHLRNAPTKLMKQLDYGKGYEYAHNERDAVTGMDCLPPSLAGKTYYEPTERGFEKEIKRRLEAWEKIKQQRAAAGSKPD